MKKRNIFSRQAVNFLWVLLGLGAGLQFIEVIWAASKGYLGFFSMMVVIVTEMVITGSIYVIIYKFLIKPCNETRKLFKHFIQSGSFQELIDQDYQIFPEQNEVMQKLDSILDKKNIIELSTKHAELLALQNQINPHFLFNTLNAIRWKASMNHDEEVADVLSELGVLLSETYKSDEEMESIGNAVRILNAYVKIMQIRFGNKVQFFFSIPENIRKYQIPRFCLQPLVENSFIHGMSHVECGVIALRGENQGTDIVLTLIDNGEGLRGKTLDLNREKPGKRGLTGIGLPNIHKRLTGLFGEGYGLAIDTEIESGFRVSLRIPAIEEKGDENESADC